MDKQKKGDLMRIYQDSEGFRSLIAVLSRYERNRSVIPLRTIVDKFPDDGRPSSAHRKAAQLALRELENLEFGRLVIGRRGAETRFEWSVQMQDVLGELDQCAESRQPQSLQASPAESGSFQVAREEVKGSVVHRFYLRKDFPVEMSLPVDLRAAEAERLANFVRTLPFEGED